MFLSGATDFGWRLDSSELVSEDQQDRGDTISPQLVRFRPAQATIILLDVTKLLKADSR